MLYPLKFKPIYKEKVWGGQRLKTILNKADITIDKCGESWEISGVDDNVSEVENGFLAGNSLIELVEVYMGDLVGESVYEKFGLEFPLLIKFIDADDDLSVQVHPDDEKAAELHDSYGKNEMWYVIHAEKNAELINGFSRDTNRDEFVTLLEKNQLKDILNIEKVQKCDAFNIPAGRIHSIGKGILLAEIQQTSDITYRIYDWNRKDLDGNYRELHTDLALDVLDYNFRDDYKVSTSLNLNSADNILSNKYFTVNVLEFDEQFEREYYQLDSFVIYICLEGEISIVTEENEDVEIKKGESLLIPAQIHNVMILPQAKAKILEVYIEIPQEDDN